VSSPDAPSLTARIAEVELEVAKLEREVHLRREEALNAPRQEVRRLALEVAALEASTEGTKDRLPVLKQRAIEVQARHELELALGEVERPVFAGMHWLAARALAMGIAAFGLALSAPACCATIPVGVAAWLLGRGRRHD
jgi:hypothetical protein